MPDARLEFASWSEAGLIQKGLPYLTPVWRNRHWALFAVRHAVSMVRGPARLTAFADDSFSLRVRRPGPLLVRVHWQPYWELAHGRGCVYPAGDWTGVQAAAAGRVDVVTDFAVGRIGARSPRCRPAGAGRS